MTAVDVDVDNDATLLFAVLSPDEREVTLLMVLLKPVDNDPILVDAEVDKDTIELVAFDNPVDVEVDNEAIELVAVDSPVEAEVDRLPIAVFVANNCEPLIASVLVALTRPAATLDI
ncbi:hypothetical protein BGC_19790 [Burkholderia sp. 3C]